jgi:RNA polymerase sigma-70 factor, ECF subfamily
MRLLDAKPPTIKNTLEHSHRAPCYFPPTPVVYAVKVIHGKGARVDDEKFESAWSAHGPAVLRYCTFSTGSSQEGEDVAAETFIRFLAKGDRVPPERVEAWLIRVARNLCVSHHRDAKRQTRLGTQLAEESSAGTGEWVRPDSWEYVQRLNETERLAVYLRIAEDRTFADIARLLKKSEAAAKMTFYRALDRVRAEMERDGSGRATTLVGGADHV